jgi:NADH-quinone oxidoreductase subunit L
MGGIAKKIPFTFIFMWIGSLALAGIPPFAGYFSKDVILEAAYAKGGNYGMFAYGMGICAALMTAFYSWRLLFLAFYGKPRADADTMNHVHESPVVMLVPLLILSIGAIFSGWIGSMLGMVDASGEFWQGSIVVLEANNVLKHIHHIPAWVPYSPLVAGIAGISLAWLFYIRNTELPKMLAQKFSFVHRFLLNKWYFDELYQIVFVNNALRLGQWFYSGDKHIVDRFGPDGMAWMSLFFARKTGQSQTGYLYHYAFAMLLGVLILLSWFMYTHLWQFLGGAHG